MLETLFSSLTLFGLGLVLGLQHALEADHVVAVSTLVSQTKSLKKSAVLGAVWGLGHTLTLFIVGAAVLLFNLAIPESLARLFEFFVGLLLTILGIDLVRKVLRGEIHLHEHEHPEEGVVHTHIHSHSHSPAHHHTQRSFFIGLVHGLAGSGALVLLVLTTVQSVSEGVVFILVFGVGSILGMWLTSIAIALPFKFISRFEKVNSTLGVVAGVISIALGVIVMLEMASG